MRSTQAATTVSGSSASIDRVVCARLDHRQVEQLVDELGEVVDLALDLRGEVAGRGRVVDRPGGERLGQQLDRGQRGAQLVADVGHEVAPHALHPAQRGDVVEEQDEAAGAQRHGVDGEVAGAEVAEVGLAARGLAARDRLPRQRVERRRAERGDQAHPGQRLLRPLGQERGLGAGAHDAQRVVDEDQQVPAAPRQERLEGRGGGRVDHAGRGENA